LLGRGVAGKVRSAMDRGACLGHETLAAYLDGRLATDELGRADRHVDGCAACRGELSLLATVQTAPGSSTGDEPSGQLGRYRMMQELGHGAMGTVLRAYDPELDRWVAVKVLHDVDDAARNRLRREAQSMARLAHPNVVAVFDVVATGEQAYVAMELIDGVTLREWARGRPWRDVLAACISAGRGLAAAHAARLVHRDFKPENVLCGTGGRVAVTDFGLARPIHDGTTGEPVAGTPAYMAPEVWRGEAATPHSDQFSFCAATFALLYGEPAFGGDDVRALGRAIAQGEVREPPPGDVPRRVWRVIARGLARDPGARFPSMSELLAALAADPAVRRRRRLMLGAALVVALAAGALAVTLFAGCRGPTCEIDARELGPAWNAPRRAATLAGIAGAGGDSARVQAALDAYAGSWIGARHDACIAARVEGTVSEDVLARRNACLDRARAELDRLTAMLATADQPLAERAIESVYALRDPGSCRLDVSSQPAGPLGELLDRANALFDVGRYDQADALARDTLVLFPGRDSSLAAEVLELRGRVASFRDPGSSAESFLQDALLAAQRARDDYRVAKIWLDIEHLAALQQSFERATLAMRAVDAAFARVQVDPSLAYEDAATRGTVYLGHGDLAKARESLERALRIADGTFRPGAVAETHVALCEAEGQAGDLAAARAECARALELVERAFGPDTPVFADTLFVASEIEWGADLARAESLARRAVTTLERIHQEDTLLYASALSALGIVLQQREDFVGARDTLERSRAAFAAHFPDNPRRYSPVAGLADLKHRLGDLTGAIHDYQEARAIATAAYSPDSENVLDLVSNMAGTYIDHGDLALANEALADVVRRADATHQYRILGGGLDKQAAIANRRHDWRGELALHERALAAYDRQELPFGRAWNVLLMADDHLALGESAKAIDLAEQALVYLSAHPYPYEAGCARFTLAKALWASGRDRVRARQLARDAIDTLKTVSSPFASDQRREAEQWLTAHR
jgi:tetratricopeptide (TPR) repeat protein